MDLTHEDVQRIVKIVDEAEHLEELELVYGDVRLHVRRQGSGGRAAQASLPRASSDAAQPAAPRLPAAKVQTEPRPVPKGMVAITIPEGRYAIFTHKGKVETIMQTMRYIFGSWLPGCEYELRDAPHLEIYDERFVYGSEDSVLEIGVPII